MTNLTVFFSSSGNGYFYVIGNSAPVGPFMHREDAHGQGVAAAIENNKEAS